MLRSFFASIETPYRVLGFLLKTPARPKNFGPLRIEMIATYRDFIIQSIAKDNSVRSVLK